MNSNSKKNEQLLEVRYKNDKKYSNYSEYREHFEFYT